MTPRKKPLPANVPQAPVASKAQEKAMADLMDLVKGGYRREDEVQAQDRAGTSQPPASAPTEPRKQEPVNIKEPEAPQVVPDTAGGQVAHDLNIPQVASVPSVAQGMSVTEGIQEPKNLSGMGFQRPLGLDVPIQRRAIVTPKAKEKAMSATGSGWTKIGWYIQESTKAAADVEIRRLQTTGSEFLDLAVRHYISGLQMAGQDPEILMDEAGYLMQDLLKHGMTEEMRSRINELLQQLQA